MILSLVLISTQAAAEWTLIQTNDDSNMYIDFDSIQKSGDLVTVSTLNDYYVTQQKRELSSQWKELHDCKNKKFKALSINYYSENMGKGNIIETSNLIESETAWSNTVVYSIGELKTNIICSRK
jgi:hypothetical protein